MRFIGFIMIMHLLSTNLCASLSQSIQLPPEEVLSERLDAIGELSFAQKSGFLERVAGTKMTAHEVYIDLTDRMRRAVIDMMQALGDESSAMFYRALEMRKPYILEAVLQDTTVALMALRQASLYMPTGKIELPK